jgi:hypothetical protein
VVVVALLQAYSAPLHRLEVGAVAPSILVYMFTHCAFSVDCPVGAPPPAARQCATRGGGDSGVGGRATLTGKHDFFLGQSFSETLIRPMVRIRNQEWTFPSHVERVRIIPFTLHNSYFLRSRTHLT